MTLRGTPVDPWIVHRIFTAVSLAAATLATVATALMPGAATAGAQQTCGAGAHGSQGYAYAGHQSKRIAHGVRATITPIATPRVAAGHVAGWVGVGGPGAGANGETQWLQVGVASLPSTPTMLYVEITKPNRDPVFVPILPAVQLGESHKVAVLEMNRRPNWWRVWVDGQPVIEPVYLPSSTKRWEPIATAETWNGGQRVCNAFGFRFDGVGVAAAKGGSWKPFVPGFKFQDAGYATRQLRPAPANQRLLAADAIAPYAFEASSL